MNYVVEAIRKLVGGGAGDVAGLEARLALLEEKVDVLGEIVANAFEVCSARTPPHRVSNHSTDSACSSDGSNLGVFVRQRLDRDTHVQYVTGRSGPYGVRKRMYDGLGMEPVSDTKEAEPRAKISRLNEDLRARGCRVDALGDDAVVVRGLPAEAVREVLAAAPRPEPADDLGSDPDPQK